MCRFWILLAAIVLTVWPVGAGEHNKTLSPGDPAPAWKNLTGTDGHPHSLADLKDIPIVVVVFTCNSCPVAEGYEDRIIEFANEHKKQVAVVAINVNTGPEDALSKMQVRAKQKKFPFLYLYNPTQNIAKQYGARYTPEFFVLNQDRKVIYLGAFDDKGPPAEATTHHVAAAVKAALAEETPATSETLGRGCRIKFNREK